MWVVAKWSTRGGQTISFVRGWDSQAVDITLSQEGHGSRDVRLTPRMISDLLMETPEKIESYGPGYTMPHAFQDFLAGKWELSEEQSARYVERDVAPTPDFFPAPAPMRVDDEALSLARASWILQPGEGMRPDAIQGSQAFGGLGLWGASADKDVAMVAKPINRGGQLAEFVPPMGPKRAWLARRWRRLRQRWLLGGVARKMGTKLPW